MARKKKPPANATKVVSISLTTEDKLALGMQLANLRAGIAALKAQATSEAARFRGLIEEQEEISDAVAAQIRGGTADRDQASLKVGETGELEVPSKPFADPDGGPADSGTIEVTEADRERVEAEKVAEGLRVPPAVAAAIDASGGEVNLTAAAAKNATAVLKAKTNGKRQPPRNDVQVVTVVAPPTSCPDCGGKVVKVDEAGVYACADEHGLKCNWTAVVETQQVAEALGASA